MTEETKQKKLTRAYEQVQHIRFIVEQTEQTLTDPAANTRHKELAALLFILGSAPALESIAEIARDLADADTAEEEPAAAKA